MKKTIIYVLAVTLTFVLAASAFAVGPGKTVEFDGKGAGKVTFSGDTHKAAKCNDCHPAIFKMKKGASVGDHEGDERRKVMRDLPQRNQGLRREGQRELRQMPQEVDCLYRNEKPSRQRVRVFFCGGRA